MATSCALARQAGLVAHLLVDGENLTFRLGTLTALVDRNAREAPDLQEVEFSTLDPSVVEFRKTAVSGRPIKGEVFIDEDGALHRILLVRETDLTYRCICLIARPDAADGDARITEEGDLRTTEEGDTRIIE